jgi:hypothetical protein
MMEYFLTSVACQLTGRTNIGMIRASPLSWRAKANWASICAQASTPETIIQAIREQAFSYFSANHLRLAQSAK